MSQQVLFAPPGEGTARRGAAIQVDGVSKSFRIPLDRSSTLKYRAVHWSSASRYHEFHALRDVSFAVPHGQFLGVIGHNGSGKSTLLKMLARIYRPSRGSVRIDGQISPFLELGVGFNPELNARENIYLNGAILGLTRKQLNARIDEIIGFAELEDFADQKLKNYSSGMQVRLAFAVAIQADAAILLMDEVLAVGDASFQQKCFDVFAQYKREGRTVVLVTHDLSAVDSHCDRALLIDHGALIADGPPNEVLASYRHLVSERAEAASTTGTVPTSADAQRWGSGDAEITDVAVLDDHGAPRTSFTTGQPLQVQVRYTVRDAVGGLVCGISTRRDDGLLVAGDNTRVAGTPVPCPPIGGQGTITYTIPHLPWHQGRYLLTVVLFDEHASRTYDHIESGWSFVVTDQGDQVGLVHIDGIWAASS